MAELCWKRSACPYDCPDGCGLLVETDGTTVYRVKGDPDHPVTKGLSLIHIYGIRLDGGNGYAGAYISPYYDSLLVKVTSWDSTLSLIHIWRSQAVEKLWEAILSTSRALEGDPEDNWARHNKDIHDRRDYLNSLHIRQLRYKSSTGTDFTVGMIPEAHFCGGSERSLRGVVFNPNIPSEECFISPKRGEAEGVVYATKPLSYQGQLIDKFWIRFHEGKAVEWHAEQNNDLLTKLITMDEGSAYLGECALVPYDSPIRQSGLLFYNTLFDENAACHLALGAGFADTINDFEHRTLEECRALGVNDSMIHEDFMIGSQDMDIDGLCEDGRVVPIFRKGNWAF